MHEEKKRTRTQMRWDFNDRIFENIMDAIVAETKDIKRTLDIKVHFKMSYRKIHLKSFSQDIIIEIFGSGIVKVKLKEGRSIEYNEDIFEYVEDTAIQEEFIDKLSKLMRNLMSVFLGKNGEDLYSYMRYLTYTGLSLFDVYERLLDEGRNY